MIGPKPLKILVVDDEEEVCEVFEKWLSIKGHTVKTVLTGKQAISLIKKMFFDVVFSDLLMPGISGSDLIKEIRKTSPETKIVVITGKLVDNYLIDKLIKIGASAFLQKPFKMDDITNIIEKIK